MVQIGLYQIQKILHRKIERKSILSHEEVNVLPLPHPIPHPGPPKVTTSSMSAASAQEAGHYVCSYLPGGEQGGDPQKHLWPHPYLSPNPYFPPSPKKHLWKLKNLGTPLRCKGHEHSFSFVSRGDLTDGLILQGCSLSYFSRWKQSHRGLILTHLLSIQR